MTRGVVLHSTRGGTASQDAEYLATLSWFANPNSQVSAHAVVGADGALATVVDTDLIAWHARAWNETHLGVELTQPKYGDPFTDLHVRTLAWWLGSMARRYGFALDRAHLPFHSQIPPGRAEGKSDPFRRDDPEGEIFMGRLFHELGV